MSQIAIFFEALRINAKWNTKLTMIYPLECLLEIFFSFSFSRCALLPKCKIQVAKPKKHRNCKMQRPEENKWVQEFNIINNNLKLWHRSQASLAKIYSPNKFIKYFHRRTKIFQKIANNLNGVNYQTTENPVSV